MGTEQKSTLLGCTRHQSDKCVGLFDVTIKFPEFEEPILDTFFYLDVATNLRSGEWECDKTLAEILR